MGGSGSSNRRRPREGTSSTVSGQTDDLRRPLGLRLVRPRHVPAAERRGTDAYYAQQPLTQSLCSDTRVAPDIRFSSQQEMPVPAPLLQTKLFVPRSRRGLVPRPRLTERLDRGAASSKLMIVSAPAGFGKTTLRPSGWPRDRPVRILSGPRHGCRSTRATTILRPFGPMWLPRCRRWHPVSAGTRSRSCTSLNRPRSNRF
jgi:hypothetical protein